MSKLVVISNRVAPIFEGKPAAGGLAIGIYDALSRDGGLWFGWSGKTSHAPEQTLKVQPSGRITLATVDISHKDKESYYTGYANSVLWPLCHYRMMLVDQSHETYAGYRRVNAYLARMLDELVDDSDILWVHDYHLIPFAEEWRARGRKNPIGFFLHIPFPPFDLWRICTEHESLVRSLCAFDLVGFQTRGDVRNFCDYIQLSGKGVASPDGAVNAFGRTFEVGAFPIGIDPDPLQEVAAKSTGDLEVRKLIESLSGRELLIGVDRLDYSKGLDNRFLAFEQLLTGHKELHRRITYLQIAPPSRTEVASYRNIRRELERLAGRINGQFTDIDWVPLRYANKSFSRKTLVGFMRHARVAIVTPLRDGMNLVAKEYVAAQDPNDPGALVLSQFAGAAAELYAAVLVNPYDVDSIAQGIHTAIKMPREERQARWDAMMSILRQNSLTAWRSNFLNALQRRVRHHEQSLA